MKSNDITTTETKLPNVREFEIESKKRSAALFEMSEQDKGAATMLGLNLEGSVDELMNQVLLRANKSMQLNIEAGCYLQQVKAITPHGQFAEVVEKYGFDRTRAIENMALANGFAKLDAGQQKNLLRYSKTSAVALLKADPSVISQYLTDEGVEEGSLLASRAMRERLQIAETQNANMVVNQVTLEGQLKLLRAENAALKRPAAGVKPHTVQDMNEEVAFYSKKSEIAIAGLRKQLLEASKLQDHLPEWAGMLQKNAYAAAVKVLLEVGELVQLGKQAGLDTHDYAEVSILETLNDAQLSKVAEYHERMNRLDEVEAHNRMVMRKNARPQGKGAPMKPIAVAADDAALAD